MKENERQNSAPVAIVTGGNSGIGEAIVYRLVERGYAVAVAGRRAAENQRVAEAALGQGPGDAWPVEADVSLEADCLRLVNETVAARGRLDLLVNNAGIGGFAPITETTTEAFDQMLKTNVYSAFWCSREAFRIMADQSADTHGLRGTIVNLSSVCGVDAWAGGSMYCTSKHGMQGLTRALADEGSDALIRVSAICPAMVSTPMTGREGPDYITPGDIAGTLTYLLDLSPAAWPREIVVDRRGAS